MKRFLLPVFGGMLLAMALISGCTRPDFRAMEDPIMTTQLMQVELERLHRINLTVGTEEFDPGDYPISVGVDVRNGKMLVEKFICWDECPNVGMVFLVYRNVETPEACAESVRGMPLISPDPIPGQYWGCRPVVDWLNRPGETPG